MSLWPVLCSACIALLLGCVSAEQTAVSFYDGRCADCHGAVGDASGRVARALPRRPTPFGNEQWANSVSREYVRTVILNGGAEAGLSPLMPSNQDLIGHPKLLEQLVDHVLKLSSKPEG